MWNDLRLRLLALIRPSRVEREVDEELRFHIDVEVERYVRGGLDRSEAERRVRLEFGGLDQIKEEYRDASGVRLVTDLWRDVRYAVRGLRRSPTFAAAAVISIGLGVGANSLVFSVVNALVLKPLPVANPDRVVFVQRSGSFVSHSYPFYRELRDRNATFDGLAGYRITMMEVDAASRATHEWGYLVTGNYFDVLGVRPAAGRFFGPTDDVMPGASPYAVLSHDYWQTRFGGDPSIVGATIRINRLPYTVLGVAPAGFYGTEIFYRPRIWVPMMMQAQIEVGNPWLENPNTANTWVVGRLRSDVSANAASDNLNAIAQQVAVESGRPAARPDAPIRLTRPGLIGDGLGGPARGFAFGVLTLAIVVLAIACANLASSLAARGKDRQRELAIRLSIGAGRGRIVRQLLTECLVLATAGAALGALVAWAAARALSQWQLPTPLPLQLDVTPDLRVLAYTLMTAVTTGIAFGVAPARQASLTSPVTALRAVDGATRRGWPIREALVGVQVALCFVLVATSMASIQGLWSAMSMSMGMRPSNVTIATFDLGLAGYSEAAGRDLQKRALERLDALPSVVSAAYSNSLPLNIDQSTSIVTPDDRPDLPGHELPSVVRYKVSPRFFETLGVRVLKGREFQWADDAGARRVAMVNEAFARQILRTDNAVGRRFRLGAKGDWIEIVGMVETGKYRALTEPDTPALFDPILQAYSTTTTMLVRSPRPSIADDIRGVMATIDPSLALFNVQSVGSMLGFVLLPMRVAAIALGAFGVLAIMLAITGIYGLVSYAVARRSREIAIRVAVGAQRHSIMRMVLQRMATIVAVGALVGAVLAIAADGLLQYVVYQASSADVSILLVVAAAMAVVGLVACGPPVRRALTQDPVRALYVE